MQTNNEAEMTDGWSPAGVTLTGGSDSHRRESDYPHAESGPTFHSHSNVCLYPEIVFVFQ